MAGEPAAVDPRSASSPSSRLAISGRARSQSADAGAAGADRGERLAAQLGAQPQPGAGDQLGDRVGLQAHDRADLVVGAAVELAEREHLAMARRQARMRGADLVAAALEQRGALGVEVDRRRGPRRVGRRGLGHDVDRRRAGAPRADVVGGVAGRREEVRGDVELVALGERRGSCRSTLTIASWTASPASSRETEQAVRVGEQAPARSGRRARRRRPRRRRRRRGRAPRPSGPAVPDLSRGRRPARRAPWRRRYSSRACHANGPRARQRPGRRSGVWTSGCGCMPPRTTPATETYGSGRRVSPRRLGRDGRDAPPGSWATSSCGTTPRSRARTASCFVEFDA